MRFSFDRFLIDFDERRLQSNGQEVRLTPKAFDLLRLLIENRPKALSKQEIFRASPPDGEGVPLIAYAASRIPWYPQGNTLSPDDRWIATPLKDGATTNIWIIPTAGGPMRKVTDFGRRATLITRSIAWARDSQSVYAAVAEIDADIVLWEDIRVPE